MAERAPTQLWNSNTEHQCVENYARKKERPRTTATTAHAAIEHFNNDNTQVNLIFAMKLTFNDIIFQLN